MAASRAAGVVAHTVVEELTGPVPPLITQFVERMVGETRPVGVLFYGSLVRAVTKGDASADTLSEGVLDFYVIVERQADWPRGWLARMANALLPPNVEYHEQHVDGRTLRAKVAILSLAQFRRLTRPESRDTTIWSRFSQPVRLVWVRDADAADDILRCVIRAVGTAARWAAELGPKQAAPEQYWEALFRKTYAVELRVEKSGRSRNLLEGEEGRFARLLTASWVAGGVEASVLPDGKIAPEIPAAERAVALRRWAMLGRLGRPLNVARLVKAAFTFAGGARYLVWKIQRHSGVIVPLTPFAERHPILCAPAVLWRLARAGVFSRTS
ncbi:hypothetical protein GOB81_10320 [Acetobacter sp. LMG 1627]|uniref:Phosphatidate cytidylyltransferase n=1 Tax=Acetobacter conturbans TaxID=1737472 RepID=A0ABX0K186_9PROT|nr:hypothetical protein [Acetobacter conturbans]NHN89025.1 hypothetical protein [Acetobacter conturbans]